MSTPGGRPTVDTERALRSSVGACYTRGRSRAHRRMRTAPPLVIVGNPGNRRVTGFVDAALARGLATPTVVSWLELARRPSALDELPRAEAILRLESPGEDRDLERAMLALGHARAVGEGVSTVAPDALPPPAHGRILAPRQQHLGFLALLDRVDASLASRPGWRVMQSTTAIRELFDKRVTSRRYASLGVPVPPAVDAEATSDAIRAATEARTLWVKLASGSSASCLAVWLRGQRDTLMTTIEVAPDGWFNSLRVRRVSEPARVEEILGFLLREGSHVELDVPKERIDGQHFDLRVLVVDGEPSFVVARTSPHPITNLHLGGKRGDVAAVRALVGDARWEAAMQTCRTIASAHDALHVGVDLAFVAHSDAHVVYEANAFGDLLPGLERDGLSVYAWELERMLARIAR